VNASQNPGIPFGAVIAEHEEMDLGEIRHMQDMLREWTPYGYWTTGQRQHAYALMAAAAAKIAFIAGNRVLILGDELSKERARAEAKGAAGDADDEEVSP
jgi:hypothetical protein